MQPLRINLWSGPRNISTALMYSFAQRSDTQVFDEPLYAHFLRVTGIDHPGRAETMATYESDGEKVVSDVLLAPYTTPIVFFKQMAKHLIELDPAFMLKGKNVLLIRDPRMVLASFSKVVRRPDPREVGYDRLYAIWHYLRENGQEPVIIDGTEVRKNPKGTLKELCHRLEISFAPAMLSWEAGARPEDGTWAKYWYHAVHTSTGIQPYTPEPIELQPHLQSLAEEQQRYYEPLFAEAIKG